MRGREGSKSSLAAGVGVGVGVGVSLVVEGVALGVEMEGGAR